MNVTEDGVNIIFKSCFSKTGKQQFLEYGVLISPEKQREISTEIFFLLQLCLSLQRWFCLSYWFYQQTLTCSDSLPLMLLHYLLGLPAAHELASSSLLNYLKSNFCTLWKRRDRITAALQFRGNKARDTLRRKAHIPLQMCACPLWLTTLGKAKLGTGHHSKDRKGVSAAFTASWALRSTIGSKKKTLQAMHFSTPSSFHSLGWQDPESLFHWKSTNLWAIICRKQNAWNKDCHLWKLRREAGQRHTSHQKTANTPCTFLAPSFLCQ